MATSAQSKSIMMVVATIVAGHALFMLGYLYATKKMEEENDHEYVKNAWSTVIVQSHRDT